MSSSPAYNDCPIDRTTAQIRLVCLEPGHESEVTRCSLPLGNLDENECHYEALSYEWGSENSTNFSITIGEVEVSVRENLYWALWHLREASVDRILWVDALCIDQGNERERNHQVSICFISASIESQAARIVSEYVKL